MIWVGLLAFFQGGLSLSYQFILVRLLAPYFGSTVITWACLIGCSILAYSSGGFLSSVAHRYSRLTGTITGIILVSEFLTFEHLVPIIVDSTPYGFGVLVCCLIFGFLPLFGISLLFTTTIVSSSACPSMITRIYALNSLGCIAGIYLTNFCVLPSFTLAYTYEYWTISCLVLIGFWAIQQSAKILQVLAALLIVNSLLSQFRSSGGFADEAIFSQQDFYGWHIIRQEYNKRFLFQVFDKDLGSESSTFIDRPWTPTENRQVLVDYIVREKPISRKVLQIGLGGGNLNLALRHALPDIEILTIEVNPAIVNLAQRFFFWEPSTKDRIILGDGRYEVRKLPVELFDLIVLDAFESLTPPDHLRTVEFYRLLGSLLNTKGVLAINIPLVKLAALSDIATLQSYCGETTSLEGGPRSIWVLCGDKSTIRKSIPPANHPIFTDALYTSWRANLKEMPIGELLRLGL